MHLPNLENAIIAQAKIDKYLLDLTHKDGGPKAAYYMRFGFRQEEWDVFAEAVRRLARETEITRIEPDEVYGTYYVIEGHLQAPDGRRPFVRAVWLRDVDEETPRLISVVPLTGRSSHG